LPLTVQGADEFAPGAKVPLFVSPPTIMRFPRVPLSSTKTSLLFGAVDGDVCVADRRRPGVGLAAGRTTGAPVPRRFSERFPAADCAVENVAGSWF